jgi:hypothetical protein
MTHLDGIGKLPDPFVEKLMEYKLFDPELCSRTAMKFEHNQHSFKEFTKKSTVIATLEEVSVEFCQDLV